MASFKNKWSFGRSLLNNNEVSMSVAPFRKVGCVCECTEEVTQGGELVVIPHSVLIEALKRVQGAKGGVVKPATIVHPSSPNLTRAVLVNMYRTERHSPQNLPNQVKVIK